MAEESDAGVQLALAARELLPWYILWNFVQTTPNGCTPAIPQPYQPWLTCRDLAIASSALVMYCCSCVPAQAR